MTLSFNEPTPESCYMFCYTSGTTGDPKAAMLSHRNYINASGPTREMIDHVDENDVMISYLPMAHSFEQFLFFMCV